MKAITIKELISIIDIGFEPRWITKDKHGMIVLWDSFPVIGGNHHTEFVASNSCCTLRRLGIGGYIDIVEFRQKNWKKCRYKIKDKPNKKSIPIKEVLEMIYPSFRSGYVAKTKTGDIGLYKVKPKLDEAGWGWSSVDGDGEIYLCLNVLRIREFEGVDSWKDCLYNVETGKLAKDTPGKLTSLCLKNNKHNCPMYKVLTTMSKTIDKLVSEVKELKRSINE